MVISRGIEINRFNDASWRDMDDYASMQWLTIIDYSLVMFLVDFRATPVRVYSVSTHSLPTLFSAGLQ